MNWISIEYPEQIGELKDKSFSRFQLIFKHSTRCSISSMAKNRLDRATVPNHIDFYFLDLLRHRDLSHQIAEDFHVAHESPQVLLIKNGECIYDESHSGITMQDIELAAREAVKKVCEND